ncbi:subtilisin-like protein [Basidiobolus meristosporus CBS 931.73]|uniref:Subtilisin-like protein n=1 Tax=Basidiobolus meristosporus CBS 931.73 TaxID=1314790 RepID=A0A1Y1YG22_9FUNG|nr:subtilisin-like protein [Basidiobolus meristosporus CBS 931.73]|eukprot:ORX96937.1 subtilisin-like protein [Basidiobolus meristosporus CBS 931.73]
MRTFILGSLVAILLAARFTEAQIVDVTKLDQYNRGRSGNNGLKNELKNKYSLDSFNASAGVFSQGLVNGLKTNGDIEYVEAEQVFTISGVQNNPPSWGLPRVSQRTRNTSAPYNYPDVAGEGVDVYVIDTGINVKHADFGGRATLPVSFITGEANDDLNGHGTHVSGTVGGNAYGVAKKVKLIGVKVLSGSGSGTTSGVISGVNWVAEQAKKSGRKECGQHLNQYNRDRSGNNAYGVAKKAKLIGVKVLSGSGSGTTSGVISRVNWVAEQAKKSDPKSMANMSLDGGNSEALKQVYAALTSKATKNAITGLKGTTPNLLVFNPNQ